MLPSLSKLVGVTPTCGPGAHRFGWCLGLLLLTALGVVESCAGSNTNSARPNLVIIYADDMGFGDMGTYAAMFGTTNPAPTPNMDALAAQSLIFTQAHSANAVCTPSRYSLLIGKYNWRTFSSISLGYAAPDIPAADTTLAEFLKTYYYDTAAFGKWHLGGYFYRRDGTPYTARDNSAAVGTLATNVDWEHPLAGTLTQLANTPLNSDYEQANFSCQPAAGAAALFVRLVIH